MFIRIFLKMVIVNKKFLLPILLASTLINPFEALATETFEIGNRRVKVKPARFSTKQKTVMIGALALGSGVIIGGALLAQHLGNSSLDDVPTGNTTTTPFSPVNFTTGATSTAFYTSDRGFFNTTQSAVTTPHTPWTTEDLKPFVKADNLTTAGFERMLQSHFAQKEIPLGCPQKGQQVTDCSLNTLIVLWLERNFLLKVSNELNGLSLNSTGEVTNCTLSCKSAMNSALEYWGHLSPSVDDQAKVDLVLKILQEEAMQTQPAVGVTTRAMRKRKAVATDLEQLSTPPEKQFKEAYTFAQAASNVGQEFKQSFEFGAGLVKDIFASLWKK